MVNFYELEDSVSQNGFFFCPQAFSSSDSMTDGIERIATRLGTPNTGRGGKTIEKLVPTDQKKARPNSLSCSYGLENFPFHIDTAHHAVPSRYIVFACSAASGKTAATFLLDKANISASATESEAFKLGVFLVRNGQKSFYANAMSSEPSFLRWDPGCMVPRGSHARLAACALQRWPSEGKYETITWEKGALLVVDNWRMLHSRSEVKSNHGQRSLLRITVR